jgi:alpha-1,6-mannosyltransferase
MIKRLSFNQFVAILIGQGVLYSALYLTFVPPIVLFVIVSLASSALFCVIAWKVCSDEEDYSRTWLAAIVIAGIVFRILVVWHAPVGSDDIYRYIWDGKVQLAGIDPYRYEPSNPALQSLRSPLVPVKINFPAMKTIYPPLAEWIFAAVYACVGESVAGFKIAFLVVEFLSVLLLMRLLRELKRPRKYLSLYMLCPLPILQFAVDGHCDVLIFPFLLGMLLFWRRGNKIASYCMLGLSAIAKVYPFIFLPAFLVREQKKFRILAVIIPVFIFLFAYAPSMLVKSFPFESLKIFSLNWAANGFLFELFYTILHNNQQAHFAMAVVFAGWLVFVLFRKMTYPEMIYELTLGFFIFSSTVHPWYVTALVLILPLVPRKSGIVFAALVSLGTIPLIPYILEGLWHQSLWLMALEYLPVYYFIWKECYPAAQIKSR